MQVSFHSNDIFTGKFDGVVFFTYTERSEAEARFATKFGKNSAVARERKEFSAKPKELFVEAQPSSMRFAALVGLGDRDKLTPVVVRDASAVAAARLRDLGCKHIAFEAPQELDAQEIGQAITEGALLGAYQYTRYKTQKLDQIKKLESINIVSERTGVGVRTGVEIGRMIAQVCNEMRDLQNTPSQDLVPDQFAQEAVRAAKREKLSVKVFDRKALEKGGFGGNLSVGRGSKNEPRLVVVEHAPKGAKKTVAIVGKGITFDTGGISIKPAQRMAAMKFDMSGAAAALGVGLIAARLRLPIRVLCIMALAENMPDGAAYKPGDVVRTRAGKTIEIDNTDAEGRVVLSDALHYAAEQKPDHIVDLATLTGACVVALGDVAAGVMGTDQTLIDALEEAGVASGERIWQLPLWDEYDRDVESGIADVKNVGMSGMAGTIAGAALLKQFVGSSSWAHLDIAGVAWADSRDIYYSKTGNGTAFGVRLLTQWLRNLQ